MQIITVEIELPERLLRLSRKIAQAKGVSLGVVVEWALLCYLKEGEKRGLWTLTDDGPPASGAAPGAGGGCASCEG